VRGRAAFDELRLGVRDIEFIADPGAGELRIGCPESIAAGFLVSVLEKFSKDHPRVRLHVVSVYTPTVEFPEVHDRKIDLAFARLARNPVHGRLGEQLNAEVLFNDRYSVVVGAKSKWARRKVGLADLVDEPWIMTPLDALGDSFVAGAFRKRGLKVPSLIITTFSIHLRNNLVGNGEFITALPRSVLQIYRKAHALKELPIDLSVQPCVAIVTLRNRTLTPRVQSFIQCAREIAQSFARRERPRKTPSDIVSA
jgi:DNA-binding transcriptional LysR family regulator